MSHVRFRFEVGFLICIKVGSYDFDNDKCWADLGETKLRFGKEHDEPRLTCYFGATWPQTGMLTLATPSFLDYKAVHRDLGCKSMCLGICSLQLSCGLIQCRSCFLSRIYP